MVRFAVIENSAENYQQSSVVGIENAAQVNEGYGFVDEILDSRVKPEKQVVLFNITLDYKHKKELIKQIKDSYGRVCLFLTEDESDFSNTGVLLNTDNSIKDKRFSSNMKEVDVCTNYGEPFNPNDINIIIRFKPKRKLRKTDCESRLTHREEEIMNLLSQGLLYKEIAKTMHISFQTVKSHLKHIYTKLQVSNRTEAILKHLHPR